MEEHTCSICREELETEDFITRCGHNFHEDCIKDWVFKNSNCPYCFQTVSASKETELFLFKGGEVEELDEKTLILLLRNIYQTKNVFKFRNFIQKLIKINWDFYEKDTKECFLLH